MIALLAAWLAPLLAALLIAVRLGPLRAIVGLGAGAGLVGSAALVVMAAQGQSVGVVLAGLPAMPLHILATPLTALLSLVVATVAASVLAYALGYMRQDAEKRRFFLIMLAFVSAMQTLVLAGDWVTLIGGWELIGFCSYLLIGFWHEKPGVAEAANRAFLYTRTLDLGLFVGVFVLIGASGSSDISTTLGVSGLPAILAGFALLLAAMGKSAQVPFQNWLQQAMAGPTPVSALLHSATLVAAGAILLIRISPLLPPPVLLAIALVGGATTVVTGVMAFAERDLKRLLAASTSSQYGLILLAIGAGVPLAGLFHLITHAAMKSALFLGAGVFQHDRHDTQFSELRGAGRSRKPIFAAYVVAALALSGIPPLAGFFSKDAIVAATMASQMAWALLPLALLGTILTGTYMARSARLLWQGPVQERAGLGPSMQAGLYVLAGLSVVLGFLLEPVKHLVGGEIPEAGLAWILGLVAALSGLGLGWFGSAGSLLGPLRAPAEISFAFGGGMKGLVADPLLALARWCGDFEERLHAGVVGVAKSTRQAALGVFSFDVKAIDGAIFSFADNMARTGQRARKLQSGFIHKELGLSVAGLAILALILLFGQPQA